MQETGIKTGIDNTVGNRALNMSPAKMAIVMTLAIFLAEIVVMLLIDRLPAFSPLVEAFVDSCFLILLLVPVYLAFYRPFWRSRQQSQEEIRQLNNRLTVVSEEERRRIALDLHDHCDQTLVALRKTVELVQAKIIDTNEEAAALCQEVDELLGRLNHDVRAVSAALHPPQLEENGLIAAIGQYLAQFQKNNVNITFEYLEKGEPCHLDGSVAIALYRIVQEATKNAVEHADPGLVRVYLDYAPDSVAVSVVDDGKGFDVRLAGKTGGLGLVSMRERARAHAGTLNVFSEEGRGTSLRATFKLRKS